MCWAYRFSKTDFVAANAELTNLHEGRVIRSGKESVILTMERGLPTWTTTRWGTMFPKENGGNQMIWNARDDKIKQKMEWRNMLGSRFVIPVDAYVENNPNETWYKGETGWLVGIFSRRRRNSATITEEGPDGTRRPILIQERDVIKWLSCESYDAMDLLRKIGRVSMAEADLFETKALEIEARSHVAVPRAA